MIPWLDHPIVMHSPRMWMCDSMLTPEQCDYQHGYWRFWYQADHRYGLAVVFYCIAMALVFAAGRFLLRFQPKSASRSALWRRGLAFFRYQSYRAFRIRRLGWHSPPLGILVLGGTAFVFFFGLMLGPKPYYWPSIANGSFGDSQPIATRSGWMALALLPFVIALPMKLNLITQVTGITHEKLQVFHRWAAWFMFVLALVHTFPFIVKSIEKGEMEENWRTSIFYWTGVVALLAQAYLTFFSIGPIRARFYEFFKATHILVAVVFVVFFFLHCDFTLSSCDYFIATGVVYFAPFACAQLRTFLEYGGFQKAMVELQPNDTVRLTIPSTSYWKPGQHMFLRFMFGGLNVFSQHPFTICSLPESGAMVFQIRVQKGITARLAKIAATRPGTSIPVLLDGPYGGLQETNLASFDRVLIVAGGSGGGFTFPVIEDFLRRRGVLRGGDNPLENKPGVAPGTHLKIVLSTRDAETQQVYEAEVRDLLSRYYATSHFASPVKVELHVTGEAAVTGEAPIAETLTSSDKFFGESSIDLDDLSSSPGQKHTPVITIQRGRPNIAAIVRETTSTTGGTVGVAVCGPSSMINDTQNAVAEAQRRILTSKQGASEVYLHTEHFWW